MPKKILYENNNFVLFNNYKLTCFNNTLNKYQLWDLYLLLDKYFEDWKDSSKYESLVEELENDIAEKEDIIENLEDEIRELENEIDDKEYVIEELKDEIEGLKS